jgi:hypothetical protein
LAAGAPAAVKSATPAPVVFALMRWRDPGCVFGALAGI